MSRGVGQGGFPNPSQDPFAGMGFGFGPSLFNDPVFSDPFFTDPFGSMFGRQGGIAGRGIPGGIFGGDFGAFGSMFPQAPMLPSASPFGFDDHHLRQQQEHHNRHLQQQQQQRQQQQQQQQQEQQQQHRQRYQQHVSAPAIQEVHDDDEAGLPHGYHSTSSRGAKPSDYRETGGERPGRRSRAYIAKEPIVELPDDEEEEEQDGKRRREREEEEEDAGNAEREAYERQQQYSQGRNSAYPQQQQQQRRSSTRQQGRSSQQQATPNHTHETLVTSSSPFNALSLFGGGLGGGFGAGFGGALAGLGGAAGGGASYSFQSSTVTYSGIGGQTYYSESSSHQIAANGVVEAQHQRRDSRGRQSMTVARGLGDKARTLSCTREGGQQKSYEILHNMSQEEAATFDSTWQHHARHALPPSASAAPSAPPARLALPSSSHRSSSARQPSEGPRGGGHAYGY